MSKLLHTLNLGFASVLRTTISTYQKQYTFQLLPTLPGKGDVDFVRVAQNRHHKKRKYRSAEG